MKFIYHERQESALCGQHCLNNLLQGPLFTAADLASIAAELDSQERALGTHERDSANVDDSGNFSIQVLRVALQRYSGIDLRVWFQKSGRDKEPSEQKAFIVNRSEHWIAIRKIHGKWWNLNSVNDVPELVSDFYLSALLLQLREDGFTVFIVDGAVPDCSDRDSGGNGQGGEWHEEAVLLGTKARAEGRAGFEAFQGTGHRLGGGGGGTASTSTATAGGSLLSSLGGDYDEDEELMKAIMASLQPPGPTATSTGSGSGSGTAGGDKEGMRAKRLAALAKQGIA